MSNVVPFRRPQPKSWESPDRDGHVRVFQSRPGVWDVEDMNFVRGHSGIVRFHSRAEAVTYAFHLAEANCFDLMIEGDAR